MKIGMGTVDDQQSDGNISDTAHWVAAFRALETKRPDALFRDPLAEALAGDRGEMMVKKMAHQKWMETAIIVRTVILDEFIMKALHGDHADAVINLGAGLDTRP